MSKFVLRAALVMACAGPSGAALGCEWWTAADLPLSLVHDKLLVDVSINGMPARLAVDTGADVTMLTQPAANRVAVPRDFDHSMAMEGVGGTTNRIYIGHVGRLGLGKISLPDRQVAIADLRETDGRGGMIDGLLGVDVLSAYEVEIDIPNRRMMLWQAAGGNLAACASPDWAPDWAGSRQTIALTQGADQRMRVPVQVNQTNVMLILDTGSPVLVLTARAAARAAGGIDDDAPMGVGMAVNNRNFSAHAYRFSRVAMANTVARDVIVPVVSNGDWLGYDGLLGLTPLLQGRHFWISYATGRLFLQP